MSSAGRGAAVAGVAARTAARPADAFALRTMTQADLPAALLLSRSVSWPHRLEDWRFGYTLGQGVVATIEDEVVGTAMAWPDGDRHATLGMIIVSSAHQGAGLGRQMMQALLAQVGDRVLMLNATREGLALYGRMGFSAMGEIHQHQARMRPFEMPALDPGEEIVIGDPDDLPLLASLGAQATGLRREAMLAALLETAGCAILIRNDTLEGFSFCREFGRGLVVGPVVASDASTAKKLIGHWLCRYEGRFLRIDVPREAGLGSWLSAAGLPSVDIATAMARGARPPTSGPARCFALASQALG